MLKVLIIGGTNFIGRNLITELIKTNTLDLTLFNRGITNPTLFPSLKRIYGDRNTSDVNKIAQMNWDCVIDLSCYFPDSIEQILALVNGKTKKYIFISTCSVYNYKEDISLLKSESAVTLTCDQNLRKDTTTRSYGNRKAECERILINSGIESIILRPALVYGEYDHTDRFYYWLYQTKKNNPLLMPSEGKRLFSCTYVKDLVKSIITSMKHKKSGTYNIISNTQLSIKKIVLEAASTLNKNPDCINAAAEFLKTNAVSQWNDLPLWIDGDYFTFSNRHSIDDLGIEITDFHTAITNTINYYNALKWTVPKYGMDEKRRKKIISLLLEK